MVWFGESHSGKRLLFLLHCDGVHGGLLLCMSAGQSLYLDTLQLRSIMIDMQIHIYAFTPQLPCLVSDSSACVSNEKPPTPPPLRGKEAPEMPSIIWKSSQGAGDRWSVRSKVLELQTNSQISAEALPYCAR